MGKPRTWKGVAEGPCLFPEVNNRQRSRAVLGPHEVPPRDYADLEQLNSLGSVAAMEECVLNMFKCDGGK